jgi:hypothetical protein
MQIQYEVKFLQILFALNDELSSRLVYGSIYSCNKGGTFFRRTWREAEKAQFPREFLR